MLNTTRTTVSKDLTVHRNLDHELVKNADKLTVAYNAAMRYEERKSVTGKRDVDEIINTSLGLGKAAADGPSEGDTVQAAAPTIRAEIMVGEFQTLLPTLALPPFNFLHCDLPYGVNTGNKSGQSAAKITGHYEDTQELYFELLSHLIQLTKTPGTPHTNILVLLGCGWTPGLEQPQRQSKIIILLGCRCMAANANIPVRV